MPKITRRSRSLVSNIGLFAAVLFVVTPLQGCSSNSSNGGGTGGHGGASSAGNGGGTGTGGHTGSGGGSASGGAVGSGGTSGGASGGNPGGTGTGGGSATGGTAGAATATGGTGNGGTAPKASGGNSAGGSGSSGGKSGTGGMKAGGNSGSSGGAAGGHAGTNGSGSGGSGTGGAGAGGSGTVSTATLLVNLANAFCATARGCCAMAGMTATLDDCETQFPSRLPGLSYVNQGTETIDNTALASCIAGYKSAATTCAFQPLYAACSGVFVGTKSEGAACGKGGMPSTSGSGECKVTGNATLCVWTGDANVSTTTGVCHTPPHGQLGDPCAISCAKNQSCVFDLLTSPGYPTGVCFETDGLYCSSDTNPVCASIVPTGGSCDDNPSCASTDYCDSTSGTGMCRTGATLGQACDDSAPECVQGMSLECGTDNKCQDLGFAFDTTCGGTPLFP